MPADDLWLVLVVGMRKNKGIAAIPAVARNATLRITAIPLVAKWRAEDCRASFGCSHCRHAKD